MKRFLLLVLAIVCASAALGAPGALSAANANVGYVDFSFGSAPGSDPTADKPQSKLWFNDGLWWATMFHTGSNTWHIYKLNWPSQWVDTGTVIDTRPTSRADALWDDVAHKLYIASLVRFGSSTQEGLFSRFSYDTATKTYTLDSGFPKVMMTGSAETLAMDKDSTGQFWITFTQGSKVYVNRTIDSNLNWGASFVVPGPTTATSLNSDDISSLVAYTDQDGSSIGVLWSNHKSPSTMYFTRHRDSDDDATWPPTIESIYTATCAADDHINLKSLQTDPSGAIYAAVKTSFGDTGCGGTSSSPLLRLVVRKPNNTWQVATFSTVGDDETRPQVLLDTTNRKVYMFATSPTSCGVIYMKSSSMDNLSFPTGKGTPFVSSSTYTCLNNVTSTKQTVNAASGLVVMASDESKLFYMHNTLDLGAPPSDTTPPTVSSKTPAANATNVATGTSVSAIFSEAVTGVSSTSFTLTPAGGADVAATVAYNASSKTATLTPAAALAPNTTYTASLAPTIIDTAGNALAATSWSFTTAAPDTTAPGVTATTPLANATGVNTSTSFSATFSEAVTGVSGSSFTLSGPSGTVAATVSYNASTNTATLVPNAALAANTSYTANLLTGITDMSGNALVPVSWSFTTASAPVGGTQIKGMTFENGSLTDATTGADSIVGTVALETATPLKGAASVTVNTTSGYLREDFTAVDELYASFYIRVNTLGASARLALITNGTASVGSIYLTSAGALQLRNGSTTLGSNSPVLTPGTLYRVGLHQKKGTGSNAVLEAYLATGDAAFTTPFAANTALTFTTQASRFSLGATNSAAMNVTLDTVLLDTVGFSSGTPPADTTAPTVSSSTPAINAANVLTTASISVTFSEAVTGVSGSTFTLSGPSGAVTASVSYNASTNTATLVPGTALAAGTTYTANLLTGIADMAGNALVPTSWSFTTMSAPPADTTPPTVTAATPLANAIGVSTGTSVSATFSEAVAGVNGSTFTLSGPGGAVAVSISYNASTNTATLVPSAALSAGTTYTANLLMGIADTAGNALVPVSWSFTTASAPSGGTTLTFAPVADTYVSQASPTTSYGTGSSFSIVDGATTAKQAFLRFTVSGLPTGAAIQSVKLRLYVTNDSTSGGIVKQVSDTSWPEVLTWNTRPAIDGPTVATLGAAAVNATMEIDLSSVIVGNGTYSFAIALPAGNTNTLGYASREASTVSTRPQLVITTN